MEARTAFLALVLVAALALGPALSGAQAQPYAQVQPAPRSPAGERAPKGEALGMKQRPFATRSAALGLPLQATRAEGAPVSPVSKVVRPDARAALKARPAHHSRALLGAASRQPEVPAGRLVLAAVGGWAGGALLGGGLGYALIDDGESWILVGAPIGAVVGASTGLPLGVHLANGRRGSYPLAALASAGIGVGGGLMVLGITIATDVVGIGAAAVGALGTVALQTLASIDIERGTAPR